MVNSDNSLASSYMGWLTADPQDADVVGPEGNPCAVPADGGASFTIVRSSPGGDDYHALWIDPRDPQRMITGADQGAVVTVQWRAELEQLVQPADGAILPPGGG